MTIKMIIATDENFGIGINNTIPWQCKEDLQYFKEQTKHDHLIYGRNTWESLPFYPEGFPERDNTIMSNSLNGRCLSDEEYYTEITNLRGVESILKYHYKHAHIIWIVGGASVYKQLLPYVQEVHHTTIKGKYKCDTFFDMKFLGNDAWKLTDTKVLCEDATVNVWKRI